MTEGITGIFLPAIVVAILVGIAFIAWRGISNTKSPTGSSTTETWTETGVAIAGAFADADIVDLENGKFRMYYSAEPETPGFNGQVYSAISNDGINWSQEEGTRLTSAIFPSVIKLPDGRFRMYFQDGPGINSAISADGLSWEKEQGTRVDVSNATGLSFSRVLAPTVIKIGDEYVMVYEIGRAS